MADRDRDRNPQQIQIHPNQPPHRYDPAGKSGSILPRNGPSTGTVLAILTLLPVGAGLLGLAGLTLAGSLVGLAVATPLFVIFSPILVPAALVLAGAIAAFLASGAFGLTGLSSLSWVFNSVRRAAGGGAAGGRADPFDYAKRRVQEGTAYLGEKTKQVGDTIKSKAQDEGGATAGAGAGGRT